MKKIILPAGALALAAGLLTAPAAQADPTVYYEITATGVPALVKPGQSVTLKGTVKVQSSGAPAAGTEIAIAACGDTPWAQGGDSEGCDSPILLKTGSDGSYQARTKIPAQLPDTAADEQYYKVSVTGGYGSRRAFINYAKEAALTVKASKRVKRGHAAVVVGSLKFRLYPHAKPEAQWAPQAGVTGRVYFRVKGTAKWIAVGKVKTNAKGGFKLAFKDWKDGFAQVRFPQTGVTFAANSAKHFIDVH
jgi:hypothetical protein